MLTDRLRSKPFDVSDDLSFNSNGMHIYCIELLNDGVQSTFTILQDNGYHPLPTFHFKAFEFDCDYYKQIILTFDLVCTM